MLTSIDTTPLAQEAENKHLEALATANKTIEQQRLDAQENSVANCARIMELEQKVSPENSWMLG